MKEHFKPKTLMFYGSMIGSVVVLFQVVSWYGETSLKAPPNLSGRYVSDKPLSGCPGSTRLAVQISQSGVYLHGAVAVGTPNSNSFEAGQAASQEHLPLAGTWDQQSLMLTGTTPISGSCQLSNITTAEAVPVTLRGQITDSPDAILQGTIALGENGAPVNFTAKREASAPKSEAAH